MSFLECVHPFTLRVNLIRAHVIDGMRRRISQTALFGDVTRGPRIIGDATRNSMRDVLREVQDGSFAREWMAESSAERLHALVEMNASREIERVGARVRALIDRPA